MAARTASAVLLLLSIGMASAVFCPENSKFNGCRKTGCIELPPEKGSRQSTVVCDACGEGYILAFGGTKHATCECAPGWAGKNNNGICMQCPAGTHIATGGPIAESTCLSCPEGSLYSEEARDCLCPSGTYFREEKQAIGFKDIACRACPGRTEFMDMTMHTRKECKVCPAGLLATVDHIACVPASHPAALTVSKHRAQLAAMREARRSTRAATEGTDSGADGQKKGVDFSGMLAGLLSKWGSKDTADAASAEEQKKDDKAPAAQPSKDAAPAPEQQQQKKDDAPASGSTPAKTSAADKPVTDAPAKTADPTPAAAAPVKPAEQPAAAAPVKPADEQPAAAKKPEPAAAPVKAAEPAPAAGADKKPVA